MNSLSILVVVVALAGAAYGNPNRNAIAELLGGRTPKPGCNPVMCMIFCQHGFETDQNGCDTCRCRAGPTCSPVMCEMFCEHGFVTDENGCEVCGCKPKPTCRPVTCQLACPHGFLHDPSGCPRCSCNLFPTFPHRPTLIPPFIDINHGN